MMAPQLQITAQIFEDPQPISNPKHKRSTSVSDVLRGRRKENSPSKTRTSPPNSHADPSPLGERHINSPPQPRKIPLKDDGNSRPSMHKKTSSSTSLKTFLMGRDRTADLDPVSAPTAGISPGKSKSSTSIVGLMKKKSKKDLQDNDAATRYGAQSPRKVVTLDDLSLYHSHSPERPVRFLGNSPRKSRTLEEEIQLYTPKEYSGFKPPGERISVGHESPEKVFVPPQRPLLEHKTSRSSIFTENLEEKDSELPVQHSRGRQEARELPDLAHQSASNPFKTAERVHKDLKSDGHTKRSSRILDTIATLKMKSRRENSGPLVDTTTAPLSPQELDSAMEQMLGRYDIPQNLRDQLRNLKPEVKAGLMKGDRVGGNSSDPSTHEDGRGRICEQERPGSKDDDGKDSKRSRSRSRTRSRILSFSRRHEGSPTKAESSNRSRSKSRPKSVDMGRPLIAKGLSSAASIGFINVPDSAVTPGDFIHYLREVQKPALVEVSKLHKLRILLRNESVAWTDAFVKKGGMDEIVQLLYRIMNIEWREEHEDNLLHETLLCLKGLSTTSLAMQQLRDVGKDLFPALLRMLFDPERKGPAEYNTRGVIISLIFSHLSATLHGDMNQHQERTRQVLSMLRDEGPADDKQPLDFVSQMHISRPYRTWCKEVTNVTKEVFWIFLHHLNVVPVVNPGCSSKPNFTQTHFPSLRPPHPAAPYVGGVEWEATQYLALHLDLLNGLIVSLPTAVERNTLREELRQSGWEKVMGGSLRTCKEKFYGAVHDGLITWVAAANQDGWYKEDVRAGPPRDSGSPKKSPAKKPGDGPPKIALNIAAPVLGKESDGWL